MAPMNSSVCFSKHFTNKMYIRIYELFGRYFRTVIIIFECAKCVLLIGMSVYHHSTIYPYMCSFFDADNIY